MFRLVKIIGALAIAFIASELFVRALVPSTILFGTWQTEGAYTPDSRYGFVPTPNYRGVMSHPDGVFEVPLSLDENGFRMPAESSRAIPQKKEIVLMGGASMMFGYGTPTHKTIAGHIAEKLSFPSCVRSTSFPGLDLNRNFHLFEEKLSHKIHPTHLIVGLYYGDRHASSWMHLKEGYGLPPATPYESLFRLFKGQIVFPTGVIGESLGIWNYRSALINRSVRFLDNWAPDKIKNPIASVINRVIPPPQMPKLESKIASQNAPVTTDFSVFTNYIRYLNQKVTTQGIQMLVVMLPIQGLLGGDAYRGIRESIPAEVAKMDLHDRLGKEFLSLGDKCWLGGGHYSSLCNERIAQSISLWIEGKETFFADHP